MIAWNFFLSSAASIEDADVPIIGTLFFSSSFTSLSGVWPPYCTITPKGFSKLIIFNTLSDVIGSKYNLSDVSKSVETVSGLQLIIIVS